MKSRIVDPADVSDAVLRQLEAVRTSDFTFLDHRTVEQDAVHVRETMRGYRWMVLLIHDGRPQGMLLVDLRVDEIDQRRFAWIRAEDFFLEEHHRGDPAVPIGMIKVIVRLVLSKDPRLPLYFVGPVYPGSFLVANDLVGHVVGLGSPTATPFERAMIRRLGAEIHGDRFDARTGLITAHAAPTDTDVTPHKPAHVQALAEYERLNPDWRDGFTLVVAARIRPSAIVGVARYAVGRAGRRLRRARR